MELPPPGKPARSGIESAAFYLCAASSIVWLFISIPPDGRPSSALAVAGAVLFAAGAAAVLLRPRVAYGMGLVAGIVALCWFSQIEMMDFPALNSWIILNLPDGNPSIVTGKLRILFVVAVVIATAFSVTRLLPKRWTLLKRPLHERTWPSILVCLLVLVSWYSVSVSPYRVPLVVRQVVPELTLLHVEKRGVRFHETAITVYRDGKTFVTGNDRRLFQYRFTVRGSQGILPEAFSGRVKALTESQQLKPSRTAPPVKLSNWEAEGWYVRTRQGIAAFTSENGSMPPPNVVEMFRELESVTPGDRQLGSLKDICLGFCYDPLAGLGLLYLNSR